MKRTAPLIWLLLAGSAPPASLDVDTQGLRSTRGEIHMCLTRDAVHFPECARDPNAITGSIPANAARPMRFPALPSGDYAIALFHDENGNGKLDRTLGIPSEGIGFSRNPKLWFGPPRFAAAAFTLDSREVSQMVKLKYFL